MKSTTTATPVCPPAPQPPACVQRSVEWLGTSQDEVDYVEQSTLTDYLKSVPLESILEVLERIEGIKIFTAPDLSPEDLAVPDLSTGEVNLESITQVYVLARRAEAQAKEHRESLLPMVEMALIKYSMESGKVSLDTQSATVTLVRSPVDSPEVAEAKLKLKQAGQEILKQSPTYQQMLGEIEQLKKQSQGEQKTSIRVKLWEEV